MGRKESHSAQATKSKDFTFDTVLGLTVHHGDCILFWFKTYGSAGVARNMQMQLTFPDRAQGRAGCNLDHGILVTDVRLTNIG